MHPGMSGRASHYFRLVMQINIIFQLNRYRYGTGIAEKMRWAANRDGLIRAIRKSIYIEGERDPSIDRLLGDEASERRFIMDLNCTHHLSFKAHLSGSSYLE